MNDEQISHIWDAIKELNTRFDEIIAEKLIRDWLNLDMVANIIGMSRTGTFYRLYHTNSIEPEKDFKVINGKLLIKPSAIAKLSR